MLCRGGRLVRPAPEASVRTEIFSNPCIHFLSIASMLRPSRASPDVRGYTTMPDGAIGDCPEAWKFLRYAIFNGFS